jgi:hypothetical protein
MNPFIKGVSTGIFVIVVGLLITGSSQKKSKISIEADRINELINKVDPSLRRPNYEFHDSSNGDEVGGILLNKATGETWFISGKDRHKHLVITE